jgi:hypothetical protein
VSLQVAPTCGEATAEGQMALAAAETPRGARVRIAAHCVLGVIALRRGDLAAAAHHIASRRARGSHFADAYARAETTMAQAQVTESTRRASRRHRSYPPGLRRSPGTPGAPTR